MMTTIDRAGRIVIPKKIRTAVHLEPGTRIRVRMARSGIVEIEPEPIACVLKTKGRFTVAVPQGDQPVLKQAQVDRTVEAIRSGTAGH